MSKSAVTVALFTQFLIALINSSRSSNYLIAQDKKT